MTKTFQLSLLIFAFASTPVMAEPRGPAVNRIAIPTSDLDLASKNGQRLLDRRLSHAVAEACGTASDADLAGGNEVRRCLQNTRELVAKARDQHIASASARPILLAAR